MASKTEICNLALSHLGVSKEIANLDTERSAEASACRRFYETARDAALRDFPWPFATVMQPLGLIEEDPNTEWAFSYQYPVNCMKIRRILSGSRNDDRQSRVPYKIARGSSGAVIFTDAEDAEIEYTFKETDAGRYQPDFIMALSLRLAAYIAPRITAGDPTKLGDRALSLYRFELSKAEATSVNEEQDDELPESEFIRGRD